jgi:hypothetical protein
MDADRSLEDALAVHMARFSAKTPVLVACSPFSEITVRVLCLAVRPIFEGPRPIQKGRFSSPYDPISSQSLGFSGLQADS